MNSAVRMLDAAAERYPDRPAVEDANGVITYRQYRDVSRHVGSGILRLNPGGRPVIVYLPKGTDALTVFMGAQYAGCPYAPVDSHAPLARLVKIAESLRPGVIVTDASLAAGLEGADLGGAVVALCEELSMTAIDEAGLEARVSRVIDADPIYIMYTSGSTGTPKGVTIPHRGIIDYAGWVVRTFGITERDVLAGQAPFYFDNSTFDIYGAIRGGAKLTLIPDSLMMYPVALPEFLRAKRVTVIFWVPTVLMNVAVSGALERVEMPDLRLVAFCGEVMHNKTLNVWRRALPGRTFANLYGPTEITDVCCYYIVDREFADSEKLPIGRGCENMRVYVLREDGTEAGPGEMGEICVTGSGVALGYWNAPEITARAFERTANGEWRYRTGDLGYVDSDGLLEFMGRRDNQIKLRGNRIELGEIEAAAMCVQGIRNAAAVFDEDAGVITLFLETSREPRLRSFNAELRKRVPQYMLPGKLVAMERLPHTANDKIDRVKLKTWNRAEEP